MMRFVLGWIAGAATGFGAALVWVRWRIDRENARRERWILDREVERWQQQYGMAHPSVARGGDGVGGRTED